MSQADFFTELYKQLGETCAYIKTIMDRLERGDARMAKHEARIAKLEQFHAEGDGDLKSWAIRQFIKIITYLVLIIGSYAGISKILENVHFGS